MPTDPKKERPMPVFNLSPHGPYTPEDTLAAADALTEAVRLINHATMSDGLELPGDAYTLLGRLERAVSGLPQALKQTAAWLDVEYAAGRIGRDGHPDAADAANDVHTHLDRAAAALGRAATSLAEAQAATAPLHARP
jgi:prephenate dehydratase